MAQHVIYCRIHCAGPQKAVQTAAPHGSPQNALQRISPLSHPPLTLPPCLKAHTGPLRASTVPITRPLHKFFSQKMQFRFYSMPEPCAGRRSRFFASFPCIHTGQNDLDLALRGRIPSCPVHSQNTKQFLCVSVKQLACQAAGRVSTQERAALITPIWISSASNLSRIH